MNASAVEKGVSAPLGATVHSGGVNFSVFSKNATLSDDNLSWNCGAEGPTDDAAIEVLRNCQVKNVFALELLAAGAPCRELHQETIERMQWRIR